MKEKIFEYIQDVIKEQSIDLKTNSVLADIIDSITFVKIVVALEEEFDFEFEDEMLTISKMPTTNDLVRYVEERIALR